MDKVMRPGKAPKGKGIVHTGKGKMVGPSKTQLNAFNKGKKK